MYRLVVLTIVLASNVPFAWATTFIQHPGVPFPAFPHLQAAFPLPPPLLQSAPLPFAPLRGFHLPAAPLPVAHLPAAPLRALPFPAAPLPAFPHPALHLPAAPLRVLPLPAAPLPVALPAPVVNEYAAPAAPIAAPVAAPVAYGPIEAAVQTRRTVELRHVAYPQEAPVQQEVVVPPNFESVVLHFKTASSPLSARQTHIAAPETPVEHSSLEDNPHRLVQEVNKPVIQEVREVIQPFRRITQEIRPVVEEIHTILHKGEPVAYGPLPLKMAAPAYGPGAAIVANSVAYKAKAA